MYFMLPQIALFTVTVLGVVLCVVLNLSIRIGSRRVSLYWVCALAGAVCALIMGFVPRQALGAAFLSNTAVNPLKILVLFFSMTVISVFLDEAGFYSFLAASVVERAASADSFSFFLHWCPC